MKSKIYIVILLFGFFGFGQVQTDLPTIIPPSPTAYELGKYGQIPVGMFTGTPNVNIPLYTYKTNNLSVPITVSYNSNGIKVDQLSSNVGLGWSLNVGGVITRIIRDEPDEERTVPIPQNIITDLDAAINYFYDVAEATESSHRDTEIDKYMYNFLGFNGEFVLNDLGEIVLLNQKSLLITNFSESIDGIVKTGFKIVDDKGISYYFLEEEISTARSFGQGHTEPGSPAITSWYLSKIQHFNGEFIEFIYDNFNYSYFSGKSDSFKIATPMFQRVCHEYSAGAGYTISPEVTNILSLNGKKLIKIKSSNPNSGEVLINSTISHPEINSKKMISNITIRNENHTTIESFDFDYLSTTNDRIFLKKIIFLNANKNYQFNYINPSDLPSRLSKSQDYWGYYNGKSNLYRFPNPQDDYFNELIHVSFKSFDIGADKSIVTSKAKKGLLEEIIYPTKGYNRFEYESNSYFGSKTVYPPKVNLDIQANSIDDLNVETSEVIQVPFNHKADFFVSVSYNSNGCSTDDDTLRSKAVVTIIDDQGDDVYFQEKIQDGYLNVATNSLLIAYDSPNKHFYVDLEEGHTYTFKISPTYFCVQSSLSLSYYNENKSTINVPINLGGLRVKSIKELDPNSNYVKSTRYYYGKKETPNISSGEKGAKPYYISKQIERRSCADDNYEGNQACGYGDLFYQILNSNSLRQLYNSSSHGTTYYKYVTVSHGGNNFEKGGDEHEFIINNDIQGDIRFGDQIEGVPLINTGWNNGFEKKVVSFKKDIDGVIITLKETINSYVQDTRLYNEVYGYSVLKKFELLCTYLQPDIRNIENLDVMAYTSNSYWSYLNQKTELLYNSDGSSPPITTTTNYFYENENHLQLTREETTDSKGTLITKKIYYPQDKNQLTSLTTEASIAIDSLIANHRIAIPIQVKTEIGGNLLSISRTNYKDFGVNTGGVKHVISPHTIQTSKFNQLLDNRITYHQYDDAGNPLELSKANGTHICYIWGYDKTQPIAKIVGATYIEIENILGTDFSIDEYFTTNQEDDLRNGLPNAQITTMDYYPLIGLKTVTDPRGDTQKYFYDNFNRLQYVKDKDDNILSENEYHYRP